jgi:hypothetical protein
VTSGGSSVPVCLAMMLVPGMRCWLRWWPRCGRNWPGRRLRWRGRLRSWRPPGSGSLAAGVPVHGCHQRIQRLVAAGGEKRRGDLVLREEVPALVAAFDEAVGVEQEPVTGPPACGERGEVIVQAKRQGSRLAGQWPQAAVV